MMGVPAGVFTFGFTSQVSEKWDPDRNLVLLADDAAPSASLLDPATVRITARAAGTVDAEGRYTAAKPGSKVSATFRLSTVGGEWRISELPPGFGRWITSSEVSRLSAHASTEPFPVSPDTLAAFALARRASELSGGALDATVAPLVDAWGFGPSQSQRSVPADDTLAALRARVDYRLLELDAARSTVTKRRPDVECDLTALGDGIIGADNQSVEVRSGVPSPLLEVLLNERERWHQD